MAISFTIAHRVRSYKGLGSIQGYYHPSLALISKAMRPSQTLNDALASLG